MTPEAFGIVASLFVLGVAACLIFIDVDVERRKRGGARGVTWVHAVVILGPVTMVGTLVWSAHDAARTARETHWLKSLPPAAPTVSYVSYGPDACYVDPENETGRAADREGCGTIEQPCMRWMTCIRRWPTR